MQCAPLRLHERRDGGAARRKAGRIAGVMKGHHAVRNGTGVPRLMYKAAWQRIGHANMTVALRQVEPDDRAACPM
jgi:hypothetical protein